jgi:riboflavin synthase
MFTGIIEATGNIAKIQPTGGDSRLLIRSTGLDFSDVKLGDSIATNGVCLTVTGFETNAYWADVSNETLRLSTLAKLSVGAPVNLEKAMLATSRFGGHIVSGHVDGIGKVLRLNNDGRSVQIEMFAPESLRKYIAHKGSITVDGISLTVNALTSDGFMLNIVPHTAKETVIQHYQAGTLVNLEVDVIARYLEQLLRTDNSEQTSSINPAFLAEHGFYR